jgi:hypothetical protein
MSTNWLLTYLCVIADFPTPPAVEQWVICKCLWAAEWRSRRVSRVGSLRRSLLFTLRLLEKVLTSQDQYTIFSNDWVSRHGMMSLVNSIRVLKVQLNVHWKHWWKEIKVRNRMDFKSIETQGLLGARSLYIAIELMGKGAYTGLFSGSWPILPVLRRWGDGKWVNSACRPVRSVRIWVWPRNNTNILRSGFWEKVKEGKGLIQSVSRREGKGGKWMRAGTRSRYG